MASELRRASRAHPATQHPYRYISRHIAKTIAAWARRDTVPPSPLLLESVRDRGWALDARAALGKELRELAAIFARGKPSGNDAISVDARMQRAALAMYFLDWSDALSGAVESALNTRRAPGNRFRAVSSADVALREVRGLLDSFFTKDASRIMCDYFEMEPQLLTAAVQYDISLLRLQDAIIPGGYFKKVSAGINRLIASGQL